MKSRKGRGIRAEELCSIAADSGCGLFDADVFHPDMTFKVKWTLKTSHSLSGGVWSELANVLTSSILLPLAAGERRQCSSQPRLLPEGSQESECGGEWAGLGRLR